MFEQLVLRTYRDSIAYSALITANTPPDAMVARIEAPRMDDGDPPVALPLAQQPTRREQIRTLIDDSRTAIRSMVHVSPVDAEAEFKRFTHIDHQSNQPYTNPNTMLAALNIKYTRCAGLNGTLGRINMSDFLDLAVWCLDQLQPAFIHPWHGPIHPLGRQVRKALGIDAYSPDKYDYHT